MPKRNHFKRVQQKRYRSKSTGNPYFQRSKPQRDYRPLIIAIGVCILLLIGFSVLFSNPKFKIQQISIEGLEYIQQDAVREVIGTYFTQSRLIFFSTTNQFLFQPEALQTHIENQFAFAEVRVGRKAGNITVTVQERTSNLIWVSNSTFYLVDLEGIIGRSLEDGAIEEYLEEAQIDISKDIAFLKSLPIFFDKNDIPVEIGSQVMTGEEIESTLTFFDDLKEQDIHIIQTEVDRIAGKWMSARVEEGYEIIFDPSGNTQEQKDRLFALLQNQINDTSTLEYIDLRFGDHVYFR